ncbi:MAG: oxidoreductase [Planctomycetaceae bacterium]|nr:oxidoreductase [Planctomycetaceae bacterium]
MRKLYFVSRIISLELVICEQARMLRLGIVDFDTSHSIEFTRRFNHVGVSQDQCVEGAKVVLGFPGTSEMSPERIPGFQKQIVSCGVELVDHPSEMFGRVDAILINSLCGSAHLDHARLCLDAELPVFVDKPFACSLHDAEEMFRLANLAGQLMFTTSALRLSDDVLRLAENANRAGGITGAAVFGPAKRQAGNPGMFHYGIHLVELLFAIMGPGCEAVSNAYTDGAEVITARWKDGRLGTIRGTRDGCTAYGVVAFCESAVLQSQVSTQFVYRNLCQEIVTAFETGKSPVAHEISLEIVRFILSCMKSEQNDGCQVDLSSIKEDD